MINEELFNTLAAKTLAGEATAEEQQELEDLLLQDEVLREQFVLLQAWFREVPHHAAADTELALEKTLSRIRPIKTKHNFWKYISAAAAVFLLGIGVYYMKAPHIPTMQTAMADTLQWLHRQNGRRPLRSRQHRLHLGQSRHQERHGRRAR